MKIFNTELGIDEVIVNAESDIDKINQWIDGLSTQRIQLESSISQFKQSQADGFQINEARFIASKTACKYVSLLLGIVNRRKKAMNILQQRNNQPFSWKPVVAFLEKSHPSVYQELLLEFPGFIVPVLKSRP